MKRWCVEEDGGDFNLNKNERVTESVSVCVLVSLGPIGLLNTLNFKRIFRSRCYEEGAKTRERNTKKSITRA